MWGIVMDFDDFNDNQKKVIKHGEGLLLVEAGPGSGKTTVIVERIKYLINCCDVPPEQFLVITFTRKAADNLRNKLKEENIPKEIISKMQISTIHSFCLQYLKDKNRSISLLDDDTKERKALFIDKFMEKLGFTNEKSLFTYQIPAVVNKFGEYSSFKVNYKDLAKYLEENNPPSQEYIDFINSLDFFSKQRIKDKDKEIEKDKNRDNKERYSNQWYKARYLQVAKAYPKYLKFLDKFDYVDYDTLQLKALEELKNNPETPYKCILVDEFQDTDPLQFEIFKVMMDNSDYFTAVGDVDQHIYAFRSSYSDYFKMLYEDEKYDAAIISLNTNYRSTENIVNLTEEFIDDYRKEYSQKEMVSYGPKYNNSNFIIESEDALQEAQNICDAIKCLKRKGVDYKDIAVLYRIHDNATVPELIRLFNQNRICFSIQGQSDLAEQDEVKSILILLWYITRRTDKYYFSSEDELKDKNLKQFMTENDENMIWSLTDDTKRYLFDLEETYRNDLMEANRNVPKKDCESNSRVAHKIVKNRTAESLIKIFSQVEKPVVDLDEIDDPEDREFFQKLEDIRSDMESEKNSKTILEIFYELLTLNDYFESIENDPAKLYNLAILTQTIHNYESFISETDMRGLYFFLTKWIEEYGSYYSNEGGVQLMTVHAAKGLEFPVTIVSNLEKNKFPKAIRDPERKFTYIKGTETFYTPTRFLDYKDIPIEDEEWLSIEDYDRRVIEEENKLDEMEELRIVYVAMTRAADLLILSCIGEVPDEILNLKSLDGESALKEFCLNDLNEVCICKEAPEPDEETLVMNYSKYTKYCSCPFKYNLGYNMGFSRGGAKAANRGTAFHNIMEKVNLQLIDNEEIALEQLVEDIHKEYGLMFDIEENPEEFEEFKKNVVDYYEIYSKNREVLEAEYDFEIDRGEYLFNGSIDLIYKTGDNEIEILDYKYAEYDEDHIDGYTKQLHLYAAALKSIPEYKDFKIKNAITHFVLGDYQHVVEITDEKIDNELKGLDEVAEKIKIGKEFPKDSDDCEKCSYRTFCKKN